MRHFVVSPGEAEETKVPADLARLFSAPSTPRKVALPKGVAGAAALLMNSIDRIYVVDAIGMVVWMNASAAAARRPPSDGNWIADRLADQFPAAESVDLDRAVARAVAVGNERLRVMTNIANGGGDWDIQLSRIGGQSRHKVHVLVMAHDRSLADGCRPAPAVDQAATGLVPHDAFYHQLDRLTANPGRRPFAVAVIDVDRFRMINDEIGRRSGDNLLCELGRRLAAEMRDGDLATRLGGDEFGIILCNVGDAAATGARLRSITESLGQPVVAAHADIACTLSVGVACFPGDGDTPLALCSNAEAALHEAKALGRGHLVQSDRRLRLALAERQAMLARAECAVSRGNILAYYQPKVDLRRGNVVGFEALLRLRSASGLVESPGSIAMAFEDPQLSRRITDVMLDNVIADMARWQRRGLTFPVAVNVSDADLKKGDFAERLLGRLATAGVPPSRFEVEITETVFLGRDQDYLARQLETLCAAGIRIALDDFGTGYASLTHLKQLPVDVIKIDRSFVTNLCRDLGDGAIVEAMLEIARRLDIEVVAEGIESEGVADYLWNRGCKVGQGFLFSEAVAAHEVPKLVGTTTFWRGTNPATSRRPKVFQQQAMTHET